MPVSRRAALAVFLTLAGHVSAQSPVAPVLSASFSAPSTFATHPQLAGYGFDWGPSDGYFGAIPWNGGNYGAAVFSASS